jgi:SET domain-containing protein
MNHSEESNCVDSTNNLTVARRDIAAHEELTCDYRLFDTRAVAAGSDKLHF